jgi:hypothetical protein
MGNLCSSGVKSILIIDYQCKDRIKRLLGFEGKAQNYPFIDRVV